MNCAPIGRSAVYHIHNHPIKPTKKKKKQLKQSHKQQEGQMPKQILVHYT